jgi:ABC-2 type transport system permease protein
MTRLLALARKEMQQLRRDRLTLAMMVVLPVLQLLLFGWAINTDVRDIPLVVYDQDGSEASRDLVHRMEATGYYRNVGAIRSYDEISTSFRRGLARVALVIPPDFDAELTAGRRVTAQLVVDGSDPLTVGSATNTAGGVAQQWSSQITIEQARYKGLRSAPAGFGIEPATWFNPELRTAVYIVPGLVGVILTMTMVMLTAMAVARERERGTLEALIVSPTRPVEIVIGKILPYIAMGYVQMTLVLFAGFLFFGVRVAGSLALLYACSLLFIAACLAIGLVFSTVARTQQQAMQMSFFFLLPNILLSGFMFPFEGMPAPAQWISQAMPLTHFLRVVRRITLMGAGFPDVADELVWLAGILLVLIVVASLRFKKKLL